MTTRVLTYQDIQAIVRRTGIDVMMAKLINALEEAFRAYDEDAMEIPTRSGFVYDQPQVGLLEWMPIMAHGQHITLKIVGYHPCNPTLHRLPTIISNIGIYDVQTGHLAALMDGTFLTALRTGAASALASRYLARPDSRQIGIIGAGAQAVTQLHALTTQFDIERVRVYDIDSSVSASFVHRVAFMDLDVQPVTLADRERMVAESDILVTATSNDVHAPHVFAETQLKPWTHINAIGSDFPGKVEVPLSVLQRAYVSPDFTEQALKEGESQQLDPAQVGAPLYAIIQSPEQYEAYRQQLTVFDSTGWALEDAVASQLMLDYALEYGLGASIDLEIRADDPLNPYRFIS